MIKKADRIEFCPFPRVFRLRVGDEVRKGGEPRNPTTDSVF